MTECKKSWQGQHFVSASNVAEASQKSFFWPLQKKKLYKNNSQEIVDFQLQSVKTGGSLARNAFALQTLKMGGHPCASHGRRNTLEACQQSS